jgi:hypothetical protein
LVAQAADLLVPSQYSTIQSAINASVAGDRVLVAQGTYIERINLGGKAITLQSVSGAAVTTLTPGSAAGAIVTCATSETASCVIDGFTITGATNGPGIAIVTASPTIRNCVIAQNVHSAANGAGVSFTGSGGTPTFTDCFFYGNYASGREGGAISSTASTGLLSCVRCTFRQNEVVQGSYGGAVHATGAATSFSFCTFDRNTITRLNADNRGGAIYTTSACTLSDCQFVENAVVTASDTGCGGNILATGGAVFSSAALSATRVAFTSNRAQSDRRNCATGAARGGAVALESPAAAQFVDCTFASNRALNPSTSCDGGRDARGGGLWVSGGSDPIFSRCAFNGNRAENCTAGQYGGTIFYENGSEGQVLDCTVSNGYAGLEGGGFYIAGGAGPNIQRTTFSNCSTGATGSGGALFIAPSAVLTLVTDCRFTNCTAGNGGAVWVNNARPRFDRCAFDHNTAAAGSAIRSVGTGPLNIPTVCFSNFCSNSGASANWILGSYADPHPSPSNSFSADCGDDCNANGVLDSVELASGIATDCNQNGLPDDCDGDCDGDGLPDDCELAAGDPDCNRNSVPDSCDIALNPTLDGDRDGIPDSCQLDFTGLVTEIVPVTASGTGLPTGAVCWRVYAQFSAPDATVLGIYGDSTDPLTISAAGGFWQSSDGEAGDLPTGIPCSDAPASLLYDSYLTIGAECADGTPLAQIGIDFTNFAAGSVGLADATNGGILYVTANGRAAGPDGRVLLMQLTTNTGVQPIGQFNLVGEESPASGGAEWHAMRLTIPDPVLVDCNTNGQHDVLEIAAGIVTDCDLNGVPDACQSASATTDCDGDGTSDFCEFAAGSFDGNNNGTPDECECVGDVNGDGAVNVEDIIDVIVAWGDVVSGGPDLDGSGVVDSGDLSLVLNNWGTCVPPPPPGSA